MWLACAAAQRTAWLRHFRRRGHAPSYSLLRAGVSPPHWQCWRSSPPLAPSCACTLRRGSRLQHQPPLGLPCRFPRPSNMDAAPANAQAPEPPLTEASPAQVDGLCSKCWRLHHLEPQLASPRGRPHHAAQAAAVGIASLRRPRGAQPATARQQPWLAGARLAGGPTQLADAGIRAACGTSVNGER